MRQKTPPHESPQGKGGELLMRRRMISSSGAVIALLLTAIWAGLGMAQDKYDMGRVTLPRTFLKARLGMAMEELIRVDPQLARTAQSSWETQSRVVRMPSPDPYIAHMEYRFFRGGLYEQTIYYKRDRVPRGYAGLSERLRAAYGKPVAEDFLDFDPSPEILSTQKTIWKDDATRITLAEHRKMREGKEYYELVLTMTDLALERSWEEAEQARLQQKESRVPIPLPDRQQSLKRTAGSAIVHAAPGPNG